MKKYVRTFPSPGEKQERYELAGGSGLLLPSGEVVRLWPLLLPAATVRSCSERQFGDGLKAGSCSPPKGVIQFGMMEGLHARAP